MKSYVENRQTSNFLGSALQVVLKEKDADFVKQQIQGLHFANYLKKRSRTSEGFKGFADKYVSFLCFPPAMIVACLYSLFLPFSRNCLTVQSLGPLQEAMFSKK